MIKPTYPDLPVVRQRAQFLELLRHHQVIVVRADTGSGKSTQLPKFLLEAGLAAGGQIGVTQPRRIAALSIADRLREELGAADLVSARIRFWEEGAADAPLKVMTDGILLQEFRRDRYLRNYSAIMIDEAHERSLNIDILLGILHGIVQQRPEFRLIISSATLDANLFAQFFPNATTLEAEGRTFPVTVEHWTPETSGSAAKGDSGLLHEAEAAIIALLRDRPDHLLCFLPTERDISDLSEALQQSLDSRRFEILPLFGRLSPQEQKRVFKSSSAIKVVLATNIAETSLTIPGIAYVVDTGLARVSRYNSQSRIQGLLVEKISQASAQQRMGRAGRVKPGRCIRLYSAADLRDRPVYTDPEILRSNLANVILQLKSLRLDLNEFPFLQAPARGAFRGACRQLHELGALPSPDLNAPVNPLGLEMARLPMDVALSAVLLRAREQGVLQSALIITAVLCIQDPRIFPPENPEKERARQSHNQWRHPKSDFLSLLKMWNFIHDQWQNGSSNTLRRLCEKHWLHYLRVREWMDLAEQFGRILQAQFATKACPLESFHPDGLHIALLSGFLGGIAQYAPEKNSYQLVGGRETHVFPGSNLAHKKVEWLVAAEVRETSRVFLVRTAEIKPQWILQVAAQFCQRRWYNPEWNPQRGFVEALEEVRFRNLVISRGRRVDYARIDFEDCAEIFWREAIVEGNCLQRFKFAQRNHKLWEYLQAQEARHRTWGLAPSEEQLVEWYRNQAPQVCSIKTLKQHLTQHGEASLEQKEQHWRHLHSQNPSGLRTSSGNFKLADVWQSKATPTTSATSGERAAGIEHFVILGHKVRGQLIFDNSRPEDGLSLQIPAALWVQLSPAQLATQLNLWRQWLLTAALQALPPKAREIVAQQAPHLDEHWVERLESDRGISPWHALLSELRTLRDLDIYAINLSGKVAHLNLHLHLISTQNPFKLDMEPSATRDSFFAGSYQHPELQGFWDLGANRCWGPHYQWQVQGNVWKLQRSMELQNREAAFTWRSWEALAAENATTHLETEGAHSTNKPALSAIDAAPAADDSPIFAFMAEQIAYVQSLSGVSFDAPLLGQRLVHTAPHHNIAALASQLPRHSGLKKLSGRTFSDFGALGTKVEDSATTVRKNMALLVAYAGFWGWESWVQMWQEWQKCLAYCTAGQKLLPQWESWSAWLSADFEAGVALAAAITQPPSDEYWPPRASLWPDWCKARDNHLRAQHKAWKQWSLSQRSWLANRSLKPEIKAQLRDALTELEKNKLSLNAKNHLGLKWSVQIAAWELEKLCQAPISQSENENQVSAAALQKLQERFKRN